MMLSQSRTSPEAFAHHPVLTATISEPAPIGAPQTGPQHSERSCRAILAGLESIHSDWFDAYDAVGADYASRDQLQEALATAPHPLLAWMVFATINVRRQLGARS